MKNLVYILVLFILSFFSCSKLDIDRSNIISSDELIVNSNSVSATGNIVDINSQGMDSFGHCWSTTNSPVILDNKTTFYNPKLGSSYTSNLTKLKFNTNYFIRPYIANSNETVYGNERQFIINDFSSIKTLISDIVILDESTLSLTGTMSGFNSLKAIDCGICWSTTINPTVNDSLFSAGEIFSDTILNISVNNLLQQTPYYFRTYASLDSNTTIYSNQIDTLITDLNVSTGTYSQSGNTVILVGEITSLGVIPVIDHGHCWSYSNLNPTINDNLLSKGTTNSTAQFFSSINLIPGNIITYYYRSYAIKQNSAIVYGNVQSFTL